MRANTSRLVPRSRVEVGDQLVQVVAHLRRADLEAKCRQHHGQRGGAAVHELEFAAVDLAAERDAEPHQPIAQLAPSYLGHQIAALGKAQWQRCDRRERDHLLVGGFGQCGRLGLVAGLFVPVHGRQDVRRRHDESEHDERHVLTCDDIEILPGVGGADVVARELDLEPVRAWRDVGEPVGAGAVGARASADRVGSAEPDLDVLEAGLFDAQLTVGVGVQEHQSVQRPSHLGRRGRRDGGGWRRRGWCCGRCRRRRGRCRRRGGLRCRLGWCSALAAAVGLAGGAVGLGGTVGDAGGAVGDAGGAVGLAGAVGVGGAAVGLGGAVGVEAVAPSAWRAPWAYRRSRPGLAGAVGVGDAAATADADGAAIATARAADTIQIRIAFVGANRMSPCPLGCRRN